MKNFMIILALSLTAQACITRAPGITYEAGFILGDIEIEECVTHIYKETNTNSTDANYSCYTYRLKPEQKEAWRAMLEGFKAERKYWYRGQH